MCTITMSCWSSICMGCQTTGIPLNKVYICIRIPSWVNTIICFGWKESIAISHLMLPYKTQLLQLLVVFRCGSRSVSMFWLYYIIYNIMGIQLNILNYMYTKIITTGHHLAPKIFIRKLPATRRVCKLVTRP